MADLWFAILAGMFTGFAILAGWDFGAGALGGIIARTPDERREVIRAIGPLWTWNEVWLIASGGLTMCLFPAALGTAFSAFYLGLHMVLWCLLLRGISLEFRTHLDDPMWRSFWDGVFPLANLLLALLFGVAFGGLVRGLPLSGDPGEASCDMPLFTSFAPYGAVGVLDWYTVLVGIFAVIILLAHGAAFLALHAGWEVGRRAQWWARRLFPVALALLAVVTVATWSVRPDFAAALGKPVCWGAAVVAVAGASAITVGLLRGRHGITLGGSTLVLAGLLAGAFCAMHPELIHSTLGEGRSLTVANTVVPVHGLYLAMVWWPFAAGLSVAVYLLNRRWHGPGRTGGAGPGRTGGAA